MQEADALLNKIIQSIANPAIKLMLAIAVMVFLYGVVEFILGADNEEKRNVGRQHIIWGLIGLFIMVSVFGIMRILLNLWK
ncbi:hypothetical protein KJ934_02620 [Patescibacteria group bacterium]|nr:hypothetical protein [Patescibacteria group bacterium]MBU4353180.1 hypothetical protein [Patescibacteria group bacterium]MBU4477367.1 hypothetical protein [Patescibacteria group bacterium]MCG2699257.1 hypothetical protein [Candidatus Parcubacteria bacterium]